MKLSEILKLLSDGTEGLTEEELEDSGSVEKAKFAKLNKAGIINIEKIELAGARVPKQVDTNSAPAPLSDSEPEFDADAPLVDSLHLRFHDKWMIWISHDWYESVEGSEVIRRKVYKAEIYYTNTTISHGKLYGSDVTALVKAAIKRIKEDEKKI